MTVVEINSGWQNSSDYTWQIDNSTQNNKKKPSFLRAATRLGEEVWKTIWFSILLSTALFQKILEHYIKYRLFRLVFLYPAVKLSTKAKPKSSPLLFRGARGVKFYYFHSSVLTDISSMTYRGEKTQNNHSVLINLIT